MIILKEIQSVARDLTQKSNNEQMKSNNLLSVLEMFDNMDNDTFKMKQRHVWTTIKDLFLLGCSNKRVCHASDLTVQYVWIYSLKNTARPF